MHIARLTLILVVMDKRCEAQTNYIEPTEWHLTSVARYTQEVTREFEARFQKEANRFKDGRILLNRFVKTADLFEKNGVSQFDAINEAHNELCIASALLTMTDPVIETLEYEPPLENCAKSIDFRVKYKDIAIYVDVKTIKPERLDRWEQFVETNQLGRFPERVKLMLEQEWLGGELWHNNYTSRARMLEHALGLEAKLREGKLNAPGTFSVLALCGYGFHWHRDDLEDFVHFYRTGFHWPGDAFSMLEAYYIQSKSVQLDRTISRFVCMFRPTFGITPDTINWNVLPPTYPA